MNKIFLTLLAGMLFLTSASAIAQKKTLHDNSYHKISGTTQEITDELTNMLGLSKQQQAAVYQLFEKRKNNAKSGSGNAISKGESLDKEMEKLLRPKQYKIYYRETRQGRT
ncbi:hypothetical protein [uncultured Aquimarina sp.]|uniref:hypothetical protein n=1 Tax=uncultured Aquimarina sp. TaxID=575652 RepID=UPI00261D2D9B|nr:hypothetical protein [uncultured Aquimarina sp.]